MTCKHSHSPMTGSKWMANEINFKTLKITNNERSKNGDVSLLSLLHNYLYLVCCNNHCVICCIFFLQILLRTMHKYYFQLIVEEHESDSKPLVFSFPLTTFIAVTAYQSARMTEMKRQNNPFAKGVKGANSETQGRSIFRENALILFILYINVVVSCSYIIILIFLP